MTAQAIIGGVGSALGGGKFQNGAVTAAFGYLFNEANVSVSGKKVSIEVPIKYEGEGVTPDVVQKFKDGIEKMWSGQFGDYEVTTIVIQGDDNIVTA